MNKKLKVLSAPRVGIIVVAVAASIFFIYGCYWVAKTVSYSVFYKNMVQQTITEMVKPESLKNNGL